MDLQTETIIRECLSAVVSGPFIPDWEFSTLFGLERREVAEVLANWPKVDLANKKVQVAINNSLNNLLGYPIDEEERWGDYISVSRKQLARLFAEWRENEELGSGIYFDNMM